MEHQTLHASTEKHTLDIEKKKQQPIGDAQIATQPVMMINIHLYGVQMQI